MPAAQPPPRPWIAPLAVVSVERRYVDAPAFAAGARRSVVLRATRGAVVRAPCSGVVTFRGSVAGSPPTLTLGCGALRATVRWVGSPLSRGAFVARGSVVGTASASQLGLSARRPGGAYLDPLTLLGAAGHRPVPPTAVTRGRRRGRFQDTARQRVPAPRPVHLPARAFVPGAGSGDVAASGARSGRRHLAGAVTTSAARSGVGDAVDWPLTAAGVAAVAGSTFGSLAVALRRRRRGLARRGGGGLAHLAGERR